MRVSAHLAGEAMPALIHARTFGNARTFGLSARRYICCFAFLLPLWLRVTAIAQDAGFGGHSAWSTEEGLPQASVHAIFQSHDGYLWLATEGGVARFDGISFETFSHETCAAFASDDVSAIAETAGAVLWFGTADGLVQRTGTSLRRFSERDGLPSASITALATAGDGSLFVLTTGGPARFDGVAFRPVQLIRTAVTTMEPAPDGSVWFVSDGEALRYGRGSFAEQTLPAPLPEGVLGLQFGPEGAVWEHTAHAVVLVSSKLHQTWKVGKDLPGSRVETLFVGRDGVAWIGTNAGLFTAEAQMGAAAVRAVQPFRAESVLSVLEDREGNHWVGTESAGLHALRPRKFRSEPAAANDAVTAVVAAGDRSVWIGTRDDGVRRLRDGRSEQPVLPSLLTSPVILSLAPGAHGDLWAGTPDGLNHIRNGSVQRYTSAEGLPDDFVRSLLLGADGSVWAGTRFGLAHLEGGKLTTITRADGLASDSIGPLLESPARDSFSSPAAAELWIGTAAGLSRWSGGTAQTFAAREGLPGSIVTALAQDAAGWLWVGVHEGGLSRFRHGHFDPIRSPELPREVYALAVDGTDHLWLRADRGVYRVSIVELNACADKGKGCRLTVGHYGVSDGMPSDELAQEGSPVLWQTVGGDLLLATRKGLAITDPAHLQMDSVAPPVVVQRFTVDEAEQPLANETVRIPPGPHRYTFEYAGLSYTMPSRVRYRYKLEGFDRDWIDAGTRRTAYYTALPARAYGFRVVAENGDGVWNEVGARVPFVVLPPFYLRWWFYALVLCCLGGLATLVLQLRLGRVRGQFALVLKERNRVAREIHDTLAQDFVSVSLQLEIASQLIKANQLPQATEQLAETRSLVKSGLEAARQSIWNLRANAAEGSLPARLGAIVERFAQTQPAPQTRIGGAYRKLRSEIEDEVLRIAGESLSNIDRHAAASAVFVELLYDRDVLSLTIRDNGRGFAYEAAREMAGHYGLRGMSERAAHLHARLSVASNPGEGTTVTLLVPLPAGEGSQTW